SFPPAPPTKCRTRQVCRRPWLHDRALWRLANSSGLLVRQETETSMADVARVCSIHQSDRHNELDARAGPAVRRCRKLTAVTLNDHAADREAQSHSIRFGRDECIKYVVQTSRINPRS